MKKITTLVLALLLVLALVLTGCQKTAGGAAAPAASGDAPAATGDGAPITIRVTTVQLDGQQMGIATNRLVELVNERLAGKVEILPYTGGQLYANTEELEAVRSGDIQMCFAVGSTMTALDPGLGIFKMPFLFPDVETAYAILDSSAGDTLFANLKEQGINVLGGFSSGSVIISNSDHPIAETADLAGLKIRTSGAVESAIIDAMGGISTVIPSEETYTGLQQKVVDGLATPSTVFAARKYQEVQSYVTNAGLLYWPVGFILGNDAFWQSMPEDIRTEMEAIVQIVLDETRDADANELTAMLDLVESEGCEVIRELTPEQIASWTAATESVYADYEAEIGADFIAEVKQAVADFQASNA